MTNIRKILLALLLALLAAPAANAVEILSLQITTAQTAQVGPTFQLRSSPVPPPAWPSRPRSRTAAAARQPLPTSRQASTADDVE
jgi:hypothetical protein